MTWYPLTDDDYQLSETQSPGVFCQFKSNLADKRGELIKYLKRLLKEGVALEDIRVTQGDLEIDLKLLLRE